LSNLSPADRRAYVITDNRLAELAGWDRELLATELQGLVELQFDDIELTGFSLGEIDLMLPDTRRCGCAEARGAAPPLRQSRRSAPRSIACRVGAPSTPE
jgi:hypothetical protein